MFCHCPTAQINNKRGTDQFTGQPTYGQFGHSVLRLGEGVETKKAKKKSDNTFFNLVPQS